MSLTANATFSIQSWEESPLESLADGYKITKASVRKTYTGEMDGTGTVEFTMAYVSEGEAEFVGVEVFKGKIGERAGSLLFCHTGTFSKGVVKSHWHVAEGSGRDGLAGIAGMVEFEAGHAAEYPFSFGYVLG